MSPDRNELLNILGLIFNFSSFFRPENFFFSFKSFVREMLFCILIALLLVNENQL